MLDRKCFSYTCPLAEKRVNLYYSYAERCEEFAGGADDESTAKKWQRRAVRFRYYAEQFSLLVGAVRAEVPAAAEPEPEAE